VLRFGRFEVAPRERRLLIDGFPASIGARAFDLLLALIERRDRLVTKRELLDLVWSGLVVEENNLQVQISTLRKLLGPQTIATIPGRGYRFSAALQGEDAAGPNAADGGVPAVSLPPHAPAKRLTNVPHDLPVLYGRAQEQQALQRLMSEHRLVTVVGAGGIGKSRLAQAVAHAATERYPDGAWMVELAGLAEPSRLPNTVAGALDILIEGQGHALDELIASIAAKTLVLVLDNCEHLLDAVNQLVEAVLREAPGVTLLATSQEPLHVPQEQQFRLVPLAVPATAAGCRAREFGALALFEARVRSVDQHFALDEDNVQLAIDICRRLDGLPLAIELAAARVGTLGLRAVRDKLDARFKLLTGSARASLRRHQTLRAALEWSHGLLTEPEQQVFRRLGVFAGSFTMELAQAVAADDGLDDWAVLDHMSALVDKSLVVTEPGEPPRYRLLESARAYALERLAGEETARVLRRHALGLLDFLRRVDDANLEGELRTDQYAALVVPELDNLRAAYGWATGADGDAAIAIALAAHAGSLIDYAVECSEWLLPLRQKVEDGAADAAVTARYWRALAAGNMSGRLPLALRQLAAERARALYRALGKPRREFSSLMRRVTFLQAKGEREAAGVALGEARALIRPDWPTEFHIHMRRREGSIARSEGRYADAVAQLRAEVNLSATTGDWRLQAIARNNLIDLLWQVGPIEEAEAEARRLADDLRRRPAALSDTDVLFANLIGMLSELNRLDEALEVAREALPVMRRSRNVYPEEWAYLFWRLGQHEAAALLLGAVEAEIASKGVSPQPNEQRLIERLRAGLEHELPAQVLAGHRATGAALGEEQLLELLSATLAQAVSARGGTRSAGPDSAG
jgi:predicted ATPase/DNA-binding winged helix-turn-helix (wHTH) protein